MEKEKASKIIDKVKLIKEDEKYDKKYSWKLEDIYETEEKLKKDLLWLYKNAEKYKEYEGKLNTAKNILDFLDFSNKYSEIEEKVGIYAFLGTSRNMVNKEAEYISSILDIIGEITNRNSLYISSELASNSLEKLNSFLKSKELAEHKIFIENIIEYKKHILTKEENKIAFLSSFGKSGLYEAHNYLTELEMTFDLVLDSKGKALELNNSNYSSHLESFDRVRRKNAYISLLNGYKKFNKTISALYINVVNSKVKSAELSKFSSYFEQMLKGEDLNEKVYNSLVESVKENINVVKRFDKIEKKIYKHFNILKDKEKIRAWDRRINPFDKKKKEKILFEEAKDIILKALGIFGKEYTSSLEKALNSNWADVYPKKGKESGAYNIGIYGVHPYVLLNYQNQFSDITTVAHEFGHAMHSYFASKNQKYFNSDFGILIAETASTVNETALALYLIENEKDILKRTKYLYDFIKTIFATLITQTMFSEFEKTIFDLVENNEVVTSDILNMTYNNVLDKYSGYTEKEIEKKNNKKRSKKEKEIFELSKYGWSRIPHFFRPFYVYKYAIGITASINIVMNIKNGKLKNTTYLEMLKSGGSKRILDTYKICDIDIENKEIYKNVFKFINDLITDLEKDFNKMKKTKK